MEDHHDNNMTITISRMNERLHGKNDDIGRNKWLLRYRHSNDNGGKSNCNSSSSSNNYNNALTPLQQQFFCCGFHFCWRCDYLIHSTTKIILVMSYSLRVIGAQAVFDIRKQRELRAIKPGCHPLKVIAHTETMALYYQMISKRYHLAGNIGWSFHS